MSRGAAIIDLTSWLAERHELDEERAILAGEIVSFATHLRDSIDRLHRLQASRHSRRRASSGDVVQVSGVAIRALADLARHAEYVADQLDPGHPEKK